MSVTVPSFISKKVVEGSYFFGDLEPASDCDFAVVCAGLERCEGDYLLERKGFRYWGIEYVVAGMARLTIGGEEFVARPGCLFGYGPETELRIEGLAGERLTKCFVDICGRGAEALFEASPLGRGEIVNFAGSRWMESVFRELIRCGQSGGGLAGRRIRLLAEDVLLASHEGVGETMEVEAYSRSSYRRCTAVLEERFEDLSSVAELSALVNLDQAYISRLFKRYDDDSPYRKLVRLKMNKAASLLMSGRYVVKEVAGRVGFEDAAHFSRVFKRTFGVAPKYFSESVGRS